MAKANKKTQDLAQVNTSFYNIENTLNQISIMVEPLMPLLADALKFDIKLVKLYKDAFNQGLKK